MKVSLCSLLTVLFVYLKLTHQIDWSWLWIVSPLWLPVVIILGGAGVVFTWAFVVITVADAYEQRQLRKKRASMMK
jgi:hypothetical protein